MLEVGEYCLTTKADFIRMYFAHFDDKKNVKLFTTEKKSSFADKQNST